MKHSLPIFAGTVVLAALWAPAPTAGDPVVTVVMSRLDNPRGLAFGADGALYVAEAGQGGLGLESPFCFGGAAGGNRCYGPTGAISRLWHGQQERVVVGLPSQARRADGGNAIGPHDVSMNGLGIGSAHVTIGWMQAPALRDQLIAAGGPAELADFGWLVHVLPNGTWRPVVDLAAYEAQFNPDAGNPDSNPYGLLAVPGGHVVAESGGNSLLRVDASGETLLLAVFPSRPQGRVTDSVPTSVAVGPDGAYYVGELTGAPTVAAAANIYRVVPGEMPEQFLAGFTQIIDIAFDAEGNLYVLQIGPTGVLKRVAPDGTRTDVLSGAPLLAPTSIAVGPDGALYVSNRGIFAGTGEVLRIEP